MSAFDIQTGEVIRLRDTHWKVLSTRPGSNGKILIARALNGIPKGRKAQFLAEIDKPVVLKPAEVILQPDTSPGFIDARLFIEAALRSTPTTSRSPLTLGRAAIDDLPFQHIPVKKALVQDRVRLLIADDVGLGKTLEAGLITSELILRGRARRILVVTTRSMLNQFQKEFWTRFSIPLSRLDSAAIRRMRNNIPAHYNVFDQFDRAIVSIDTLKRDSQIRAALEGSNWDLVIIDEAHNAARRAHGKGDQSQRAKLAQLLSRRSDNLLLLTATPHDGSQESFASLIEMLDPTRVPSPKELQREDIEDLVVRRFRSSPDVMRDLKQAVPPRQLHRIDFPLSPSEEAAYHALAELNLDADQGGKSRAMDLFRTTLAKALFSSPQACLETVEKRLKKPGQSEQDQRQLEDFAQLLRNIPEIDFTKFNQLIDVIRKSKWTGRDKSDRIVIFSERIATLEWLQERLKAKLGLPDEAIARIDGSSIEADAETQKIIEDFGQENRPIRILLASDMASEGLNLHFQSHRLFHFDLPWSLLRFQQRNGRIDRYGQTRAPQIHYFVGLSCHERVRDMWVLDKLVLKDEAAQQGVGDPAVFLGQGDADLEEEVVAAAVTSGLGAEAFDAQMDARLAEATSFEDEMALLFGDFNEAPPELPASETAPPRLYGSTYDYATAILARLHQRPEQLLSNAPLIKKDRRTIQFQLPNDMKSDGGFGYAGKETVDDRFMPPEALRAGMINLTDDPKVINTAIQQARSEAHAWPAEQYLWDGHPILEWFADRAGVFFPDRAAPLCVLPPDRLPKAEVAVLLHGAIPNEAGAPVTDLWGVISLNGLAEPRFETVPDFIARIRFLNDTPNTGAAVDLPFVQSHLPRAVDLFQSQLVAVRQQREAEIEASLTAILDRLSALQSRYLGQLELDFGEQASTPGLARRRQRQKDAKRHDIEELFSDWSEWFSRNRTVVKDPNPWVEIKAVFTGAEWN